MHPLCQPAEAENPRISGLRLQFRQSACNRYRKASMPASATFCEDAFARILLG
jgi:hypothetical protein